MSEQYHVLSFERLRRVLTVGIGKETGEIVIDFDERQLWLRPHEVDQIVEIREKLLHDDRAECVDSPMPGGQRTPQQSGGPPT